MVIIDNFSLIIDNYRIKLFRREKFHPTRFNMRSRIKLEQKQGINKHVSLRNVQEVNCSGNNNSTLRFHNYTMQIKFKEIRI